MIVNTPCSTCGRPVELINWSDYSHQDTEVNRDHWPTMPNQRACLNCGRAVAIEAPAQLCVDCINLT